MPTAYLTIKAFLMAALTVGAFSIFFYRIRTLWLLMKSVQGIGPKLPIDWGARVSLLFSDILGQRKVRRKVGVGLAHTAIFFGFLAVQPHSLSTMISSVIPSFTPAALMPAVWQMYLSIADVLAFLTLIGFAFVAYRRLVEKPPYLPLTRDALYIIAFTVSIIVTFHILTAVEASLPGTQISLGALPASGMLAKLFGMPGWPVGTLHATYEVAAWVHVLIILGFLVYIPGSKHLHLLAAVPNVLLQPLNTEKAIAATDIEAEGAESFGLGTVADLHWKNVLDLYACTECGRCHEQCPAANTGKPLSPRDLVHAIKEDVFKAADVLLKKTEGEFAPLVTEEGHLTPEQLWSCTTCRACENICPVNIQHFDLIIEARKYQVLMESAFPPELMPTFSNLENQSNPWGFPVTSRTEWFAGLDVLPADRIKEAELLFYAGSALSLDDRGRKISRALVQVLNKAGVSVAVLGAEELDTGDDARRAGNEYLAQNMIRSNIEVLKEHGVTKILTACPHTFNSLKNEYPQFGGNFEVFHHTEYLLGLLRQKRLAVNASKPADLVFHDSCYLGRWNGLYEQPRELLSRVNGGQAPREPRRNRDTSFCCGGGGARMFMEEHGTRINITRCQELRETGADTIVAACPYCLTMLTDGVKELGWNARVVDPVELLAESLA